MLDEICTEVINYKSCGWAGIAFFAFKNSKVLVVSVHQCVG